ncbi:hydroxymethylbilane synthase [Candidatus Oleimmundimicrobium sp.]|uniref:hydroxymethylbilane synthase n=1 Tax=Candidatus Oleimmundimicrobium sp. TaxID=3060597 RepID=UPI00271BE362|nr:hydroxymethylbilane synthase [Candidatus Oleimmundimicrobium sp.]MDO8885940.1 hydroxymethylbilane synthase [Candidatus Oleimmundimicrobium sp.]
MAKKEIVIGTRGSRLALWQANFVAESLKQFTDAEIIIKKIKTQGDKILDSPLAKIGDKGLFVKEIEVALSTGEADLAVHSMKDVPTELPVGLKISSILKREDPRDVLISKGGVCLSDLPKGSKVGTSSLRRKAQLLNFRPDLKIVDVRGNIDTRLQKMESGEFDAIILAAAGIDRMGWADKITERIAMEISLPAVGQGAIGIETRESDDIINKLVEKINHVSTFTAVAAERAMMKKLEGGCQIPIGALGVLEENCINLWGMVASLDGKRLIRDFVSGKSSEAEELGIKLAEQMIKSGAKEILKEIRESG